MTSEAGLIIGFFLGLIVSLLIYIIVRDDVGHDLDNDAELKKRVATLNAVTERIQGNTAKVSAATGDLSEIEMTETTPTERNPTNE